jgi:uncharacterized protein YndB with AHSA1/START domain
MTGVTTSDREITFEREFNAPRHVVFKAFTDCEALAHWWGPKDWTLPGCTMDLRPGGTWHYGMRGPNGEESWGLATYREIVEPERLVYSDRFADRDGNVNPNMPQMEISVSFISQTGSTLVKMRCLAASPEQAKQLIGMGMEQGMKETWDRLDAYLADASS